MSKVLRTIREMDSDALQKEIRRYERELFDLRYKSVTDHVENSSEFRSIRRNIARVKTVLRERELNIRGDK